MVNRKQHILQTIYNMYPDAHCELNYHTPIQLAIAVILSAQTTDESVNKVTPTLFNKYPQIQDLAMADEKDIAETIKSIGLYRNKAKYLKAFALQVVQDHQGILPYEFEALTNLAGIGRKTANVIQAVAFNVPALAVDTHVDRVAHRLALVTKTADVYQTEIQLKKLIPKHQWIHAHHAILFFGRYHCLARQPKCSTCPLFDLCSYPKKNMTLK
jgi:endonuclease III